MCPRAGVGKLPPHELKRSFVSDLVDAAAGHSRMTTKQKYDKRGEEAKRKAARTLHVPVTRRTRKRVMCTKAEEDLK